MRLLTHNHLQSNVKGTEKGYPLLIEATKVAVEESPLDKVFLTKLLPKLEYKVLLEAAQQLRSSDCEVPELPEELPAELDDATLSKLHKVVMDIHLIEGALICPDTGRRFPVKEGIPNMILHEDEV
mmetsp:Transcript_5804/g.12896  ORF Transcript_5804/g.12896 Transcript_5804/m.12896 type:complete len:126 (-) Transcript_5804:219-596(-)